MKVVQCEMRAYEEKKTFQNSMKVVVKKLLRTGMVPARIW